MSVTTSIQWTNKTWNPIAAFTNRDLWIRGHEISTVSRPVTKPDWHFIPKGTRGWFCVKVSPGCANCYAEAINLRLGNGLTYRITNLDFIEFRLVNLEDPLKWRKPCMVFVNSMTDLFLEHIHDDMIDSVFAVMALATKHTFQVLTKRHDRMRKYTTDEMLHLRIHEAVKFQMGYDNPNRPAINRSDLPLANVWLGVSVEDQQRADERIPVLLQTPAAIRFLSCEPLLGPLEFSDVTKRADAVEQLGKQALNGIHWVIVGGESGKRARPCNVEWIYSIVRQCSLVNVPCFVKQLGSHPVQNLPTNAAGRSTFPAQLRDKKGGDILEWPKGLRVREFPKVKVAA